MLALLSMALTTLCGALFNPWCRKLDIPSLASPMKLGTSVMIIPCFYFLGIWGRIKFISFIRCYACCYYMILSTFYNKLQMVLSFCKRSLDLTYIFLFLYFEHFGFPYMCKCCHNLNLRILDPLLKVI